VNSDCYIRVINLVLLISKCSCMHKYMNAMHSSWAMALLYINDDD